MKTVTRMLMGAAVLAPLTLLTLSGCKQDNDACAALTKSICSDGSIPCAEVTPWLDAQMTGPDGQALDATQKRQGCASIHKDKEALTAFTEAAKSAVGSKR